MNALVQGFNWLVSPPGSPSTSNATLESPKPKKQYHCEQCKLRSRIEEETSKQVHAFLKHMARRDLSLHTRSPLDIVMYRYENGTFQQPNGFVYNSDNNDRLVAVIVCADDPLYSLGYTDEANKPRIEHYMNSLKQLNEGCQAAIVTNYHRWVYLYIEDVEVPSLERKSVSFPFGGSSSNHSVSSKLSPTLQICDGRMDDPEYTVHRNMVKCVKTIVSKHRRGSIKRKHE